jgi:hypothetical protein
MYSALYYPHATLNSVDILRDALLFWDQLDVIVPEKGWPVSSRYPLDRNGQEALELIGVPHVPSNEEKELAHKQVEAIILDGLPAWFYFNPNQIRRKWYPVYPDKFLPKTWDMLMESNLAKRHHKAELSESMMETVHMMGFVLMAILADCCAGFQKRLVTDELSSYASLERYTTLSNRGDHGNIGTDVDRLVTISLKVVDTEGIPLERILTLRKREVSSHDTFLRDLRHKYLEELDKYIKRLGTEVRHEGDIKDVEKEFKDAMESDLNELNGQLQLEAKKTLLSKEVIVGIFALAGIPIEPFTIPAGLLSISALYKAKTEYSAKRKEVLKNHGMSWLYIAKDDHPLY